MAATTLAALMGDIELHNDHQGSSFESFALYRLSDSVE